MAKATYQDYRRLLKGIKHLFPFSRCDCVNGYAIGRKVVKGKPTRDIAVVVFVDRKLPLSRLPLVSRVPQTIRIPDEHARGHVLEVVTDVQEARFQALAAATTTKRMRPAPSGISIGHEEITAGTLGGLMRDAETGMPVILSNNHVLANSNDAAPGDAILQPGPSDGGRAARDRIATLTRFVPVKSGQDDENRVDAAIAAPLDPSDVMWRTIDIGTETPQCERRLNSQDLGLPVQKTGRTTGYTEGYVKQLDATVRVDFGGKHAAVFVDQIVCSHEAGTPVFSEPGDSGSLIYDKTDKACCVGLLFAGSPGTDQNPGMTIANPMRFVRNELGLDYLEPGEHPTAATTRRTKRSGKRQARKK